LQDIKVVINGTDSWEHGKVVCMDANEYWEYLKERHSTHLAKRNALDDLAFKTSERYDQWVLTLSGGALAISLTFLEKIAPAPAANTLFLLVLAWTALIVAVLAGFCAIYVSRNAIYRQLEIGDEQYGQFRGTTTKENPEGKVPVEPENPHIRILKWLNYVSLLSLILGAIFICCFAFGNITVGKEQKKLDLPPQINVNVNLSQNPTNNIGSTNKNK
jgi:hypothetical protein